MTWFQSFLSRRTLVFRLWLTLTVLTAIGGIAGMAFYVRLETEQEIDKAHSEMAYRQEALAIYLGFASRVLTVEGGFNFTSEGFDLARRLGVLDLWNYDKTGRLATHVDFVNNRVTFTLEEFSSLASAADLRTARTAGPSVRVVARLDGPPIEPPVAARAETGTPVRKTVRIDNRAGGYEVSTAPAFSAWNVLRGSKFGEAYLTPPDSRGNVNLLYMVHTDQTGPARQLLAESLLVLVAALGLISGAWYLVLKRLVYSPLKRYSSVATRIAAGDPVRLPVHGEDELSGLAFAVNGMADVLENKATIDALTGLYNLRHLTDHLERQIADSLRKDEPLSLLSTDLDRFKPINDTYGHAAGDLVLQTIGAAIRRWADEDFTCWRLGGDEFAISLPGKTFEESVQLADSLKQVINNLPVLVPNGVLRPVMSIGVSSLPEDGETAGTLLNMADRRMYQAKRDAGAGREDFSQLSA